MNTKQKAKKLGIDYTGLNKDQLLEAIKLKEAEIANQTPSSEPKKDKEFKKDKEIFNFNTAIVKNGKLEIRRYSLDDHGENFEELANSFAKKIGYDVELIFQDKLADRELKEKETDIAIIKNGKYEIRRFSLKNHGEEYLKLATEFSSKNNYKIEVIE